MSAFASAYSDGTKSAQDNVKDYAQLFDDSNEDNSTKRKENYTTLVNYYYDLSTDFYEYAWGTSFHFAPRYQGESVEASLARHEHFLALRLGLKPGMKVLDIGCGIGGPMIEITRFSGAKVTGVNNNAYQIKRGQALVSKYGLDGCCDFMKADFMKIPQPDNTYDAIYAIEATCHAPSKVDIYSEIFRLLKPGGVFAAYEWCMTDKYDPGNPQHNQYKKEIEIGDGIHNLDTTKTVLEALQQSGFEILESKDLSVTDSQNPICWYQPLMPSYVSWKGFRVSPLGIMCTTVMVHFLEKLGLAPKGTVETHRILKKAYSGLLGGALTDSFTPMFFFLVRKPLK